jgi:hypothetical protein
MGIGMSQLLRTKIERKFHHITVKDCIAKAELTEYIYRRNDEIYIFMLFDILCQLRFCDTVFYRNVMKFDQTFDLYIPEEEAAYLTLHFQAAIERLRRSSHNPKRTIIVCHMGIGMSQLLRTKIKDQMFD